MAAALSTLAGAASKFGKIGKIGKIGKLFGKKGPGGPGGLAGAAQQVAQNATKLASDVASDAASDAGSAATGDSGKVPGRFGGLSKTFNKIKSLKIGTARAGKAGDGASAPDAGPGRLAKGLAGAANKVADVVTGANYNRLGELRSELQNKTLGNLPPPAQPRGVLQAKSRGLAGKMFGDYGRVLICNISHMYTWGVFIGILMLAWARCSKVLNTTFRSHIMALEPSIDPDSNAKTGKVVVLKRRASRFVLFSIMFLMLMTMLLFLSITLLMIWGVVQLIELFADEMPEAIAILADLLHALFGPMTFFGALDTAHIKVHGIVLLCLVIVCWLYAYIYFREADLTNATFLRDKMIRCVAIMPVLMIFIYLVYAGHLMFRDCMTPT